MLRFGAKPIEFSNFNEMHQQHKLIRSFNLKCGFYGRNEENWKMPFGNGKRDTFERAETPLLNTFECGKCFSGPPAPHLQPAPTQTPKTQIRFSSVLCMVFGAAVSCCAYFQIVVNILIGINLCVDRKCFSSK